MSGKKGGGGSSTTQAQIDPNLKPLLYGADGTTGQGLINRGYQLWDSQAAQGGLNDYQRAGLEAQRQVLSSPAYTAGYEDQRNLGLGLMGAGVAANPFGTGQVQLMTGGGGLMGGLGGRLFGEQQSAQVQPASMPAIFNRYPGATYDRTPQPQGNSALAAMNTPIPAYVPPPPPPPAPAPAAVAMPQYIDPAYRNLFGHLLGPNGETTDAFDAAVRSYQSSMDGGG